VSVDLHLFGVLLFDSRNFCCLCFAACVPWQLDFNPSLKLGRVLVHRQAIRCICCCRLMTDHTFFSSPPPSSFHTTKDFIAEQRINHLTNQTTAWLSSNSSRHPHLQVLSDLEVHLTGNTQRQFRAHCCLVPLKRQADAKAAETSPGDTGGRLSPSAEGPVH
jgi:hypothetical protein